MVRTLAAAVSIPTWRATHVKFAFVFAALSSPQDSDSPPATERPPFRVEDVDARQNAAVRATSSRRASGGAGNEFCAGYGAVGHLGRSGTGVVRFGGYHRDRDDVRGAGPGGPVLHL